MATKLYLDGLRRLSFDGVTIPYQRIRVHGGQRDHVHEFPKVPGGLPELFGRKLYDIAVSYRPDEAIMKAGGFYQGRNLFANLNVLMSRWEDGTRGQLYIPNIGEIKAYATDWTRELDVKIRTGESVDVTFREDSDAANLIAQTLSTQPTAAVARMLGDFEAVMPDPRPSIFDAIRNAVNGILAFKDMGEMWAGFMSMKLQGLLALFEQGYEECRSVWNDPLNFEILEAFKALWSSVQQMNSQAGQLGTYTLPRDTDAAGASVLIYGDTTHAVDVISLNALDDPYNIPAGTAITYLKVA